MKEKRFYLTIGDDMGVSEHWFDTEEQLEAYLDKIDTIGLSVFAVEINRVLYNM